MINRIQKHYLDALDKPSLEHGRRLSLILFSFVEQLEVMGLCGFANDPVDFDQEIIRLKNNQECVSCCKAINVEISSIYCSVYCSQLAGTIRYARRGIANKRMSDVEFQIGLGDRLTHLPNGGYPARDRFLSKEVRNIVFERDNYTCRVCGVNSAKQIDHIQGSSNDLSNLQAICLACHREKTNSHFRPATPEEQELIEQLYEEMAMRIAKPIPSRLCDDDIRWRKTEPGIRGARRKVINALRKETEHQERIQKRKERSRQFRLGKR